MTDPKALFNIGYGLYVVTTNDGTRDNGCIVNTVVQLTSSPEQVGVTVNKQNYTCETITKTGILNVCPIAKNAPFKVFEAFGFSSGRDKNKFEGCTPDRSENGLVVLPRFINSFMSLKVENKVDLGTHILFICSLTESKVLSDEETMTYTYYHKNVKPKPKTEKIKGYLCTICGYIHDEPELPEDFECPICHHGREVFEKISDSE